MIANLIAFSVRARWAIVIVVLLIGAFGAWQLTKLPIDAVPDITNNQVQISVVDPGLSPVEIEKRVSFPIETALAGIPGLQLTRSLSRNGFAQVTAIFTDATDLYFARQQVSERLAQARSTLPDGVEPTIGPVSTGLGEVLFYTIDYAHPGGHGAQIVNGQPGWQSDGSYLTPEGDRLTDGVSRAAYLRTVQDWIIRPQLRTVAGVAGIDSIGGYEKQYVVEPDPAKLIGYGISYSELGKALEAANLAVGADYYNRGGEAFLVRSDARIRGLDEIRQAVIATRAGVPVSVGDVANVRLGGDLRTGGATRNGHEVVVGTALMLIGENSRVVAQAVGDRLTTVVKSLPPDIKVDTVLDRSKLVNATIGTVEKNLLEGALLTAAALFLFLGNVRAAVIAVLVIPFSFLIMGIGMNFLNVSGNLMSLGALDFGLIVDGAVIILENCLRRVAERQHHEGRLLSVRERLEETTVGAQEMIKPTVFGQAIIFLVFAPLLTFTGVEGKTFSPMAIAIMLALGGAFLLSLTFVPALVALIVTGRVAEKDVWIVARVKRAYAPILNRAVATPWPFIAGGFGVFALAALMFGTLGSQFIPQLDEQNIALATTRVPSTGIDQSLKMQSAVERAIVSLPEVSMMFSRSGTAEAATDPQPPGMSDGFVILKPKSEWPAGITTKAQVLARVEAKAEAQIGQTFEFSQPIELRFNELIAGVRGDVAIKLFGEDLDKMNLAAAKIVEVLKSVPGAADTRAEQVSGSPVLDVALDRTAIARFGLTVAEVADTVSAAMGGRDSGLVFEGDRRFNIVVRVPAAARTNLEVLAATPVILPAEGTAPRRSVPLSAVARFRFTEGLNQISRQNGKRLVIVQTNVRGRDVGSFVTEATPKVEAVKLPIGSYLEWGGQFQNLQAATHRLMIVVPICFAAIFALLYLALGSARRAAAVFSAVPLGLAGGVFTLALTGIAFSVSAAVGFICLSGVAVLNGLVVMTSIRQRIEAGVETTRAIIEGTYERVRPVLMTGLVPAIGFVPMAIGSGTGAEVQKPLATVVIGGLLVATVLTLLVLPAISRVILGTGKRPGREDIGEPSPAAIG
ncbi:MAG: CusA/CzcA family heavy metal efflux RND transporter [Sphingomonadales bacterium]|nr:CusA/CzcA family heavy metal efflux RND transporter [Sphingomonadales bacterium]